MKHQQQRSLPQSHPRTSTKRRSRNALGNVTIKFISILKKSPGREIDLNNACVKLGITKRRIYDVTNVLNALGMVKKSQKNVVKWVNDPPQYLKPNSSDLSSTSLANKLNQEISFGRAECKQLDTYTELLLAHNSLLRKSNADLYCSFDDVIKSIGSTSNLQNCKKYLSVGASAKSEFGDDGKKQGFVIRKINDSMSSFKSQPKIKYKRGENFKVHFSHIRARNNQQITKHRKHTKIMKPYYLPEVTKMVAIYYRSKFDEKKSRFVVDGMPVFSPYHFPRHNISILHKERDNATFSGLGCDLHQLYENMKETSFCKESKNRFNFDDQIPSTHDNICEDQSINSDFFPTPILDDKFNNLEGTVEENLVSKEILDNAVSYEKLGCYNANTPPSSHKYTTPREYIASKYQSNENLHFSSLPNGYHELINDQVQKEFYIEKQF